MEKWADYLISHVQRDTKGNVIKVLLHSDNGDKLSPGRIKTKDEVFVLIKGGHSVKTILWGYPSWRQGAEVDIVRDNSGEYLRTKGNLTGKDNLDNLIPLSW